MKMRAMRGGKACDTLGEKQYFVRKQVKRLTEGSRGRCQDDMK